MQRHWLVFVRRYNCWCGCCVPKQCKFVCFYFGKKFQQKRVEFWKQYIFFKPFFRLKIKTNRIVTVLACSGRVLRVVEHCRVRQSIELESVPTVLHIPKGYNDRLICGMTDGRVVLFRVGTFVSNFTEETLVEPSENASAVTTIDVFDLTGDGKVELIVGRRDGSIQVYSLPSEENTFDLSVRQIYNEVTQWPRSTAKLWHFLIIYFEFKKKNCIFH